MTTLTILSPGSLGPLLPQLIEQTTDDYQVIQGPSGQLRQRIEAGQSFDLFFSTHLDHCQSLRAQDLLSDYAPLGLNETVLVAQRSIWQAHADLRSFLGAAKGLSISTTGMLAESNETPEILSNLARFLNQPMSLINHRIRRITGGRETPNAPVGRDQYGWIMEHEEVDALFTYLSNALVTVKDNPELTIIRLPIELRMQGTYGIGIHKHPRPDVLTLYRWFLGLDAAEMLRRFGFSQHADR